MFEGIRYVWNASMWNYNRARLETVLAAEPVNKEPLKVYSKRVIDYGKRMIELSKGRKDVSDETMENIRVSLAELEMLYQSVMQEDEPAEQEDGATNQKRLFMDVAGAFLCGKWTELAKRIEGRQPTIDELITAEIDAYKATHEANPSLDFNDEREFKDWLNAYAERMNSKGDFYFKATLPAYNTVAEKLAK